MVVGNCLGDDVGEGVAGVAVDGLGADIWSLLISYSSIFVVVDASVSVVLLIIGGGIWAYLSPFLMDFRWPLTVDS